MPLMRAGRASRKIEIETFNISKNQGCDLGRNYGRARKDLCSMPDTPALLAFMIDLVRDRCRRSFQAAMTSMRTTLPLWERMRSKALEVDLGGWVDLMPRLTRRRRMPGPIERVTRPRCANPRRPATRQLRQQVGIEPIPLAATSSNAAGKADSGPVPGTNRVLPVRPSKQERFSGIAGFLRRRI